MFATATKTSLFKALKITKRDLRVFGLSALLFTSVAIGAAAMVEPAHSQTASAVCAAGKYFR